MKNPPFPKKIKKTFTLHNDKRVDWYHWLRDDKRQNKEILNYLSDENKYSDYWFKHNKVNSEKFIDTLKMVFLNLKKVLKQN